MKVGLGIPWFDSGEPFRARNFEYVRNYVPTLYNFDSVMTTEGWTAQTRGGARNSLVRANRDCDVLVLCDADSYPHPDGLAQAIDKCAQDGGMVMPYGIYHGLDQLGSKMVLTGMEPYHNWLLNRIERKTLGSFGGVIVIRPEEWMQVGGSPQFTGWGFEDIIIVTLMRTMLDKETTWIQGFHMTHLYHPRVQFAQNEEHYDRNIGICKEFEAAQYDKYKMAQTYTKHRNWFPDWSLNDQRQAA